MVGIHTEHSSINNANRRGKTDKLGYPNICIPPPREMELIEL